MARPIRPVRPHDTLFEHENLDDYCRTLRSIARHKILEINVLATLNAKEPELVTNGRLEPAVLCRGDAKFARSNTSAGSYVELIVPFAGSSTMFRLRPRARRTPTVAVRLAGRVYSGREMLTTDERPRIVFHHTFVTATQGQVRTWGHRIVESVEQVLRSQGIELDHHNEDAAAYLRDEVAQRRQVLEAAR